MENLPLHILTAFSFCQEKDGAGLLGSCQMTAWLCTWEADEWREKESLSLAWMPRVLGAQAWPTPGAAAAARATWAESSCGGGCRGHITEVRSCYVPAAGPRVRQGPGHGWFLEVRGRLGAPHCTAPLCELVWLAFLHGALAAKAQISALKSHINNQQGGWQPGFINNSKIFGSIAHGLQTLGVEGTKSKAARHSFLESLSF